MYLRTMKMVKSCPVTSKNMTDQPSGTLPLPEILRDDTARSVVAALTAAGAEVRFVGGCVRDVLSGATMGDVDLATSDMPETVINLAEAAGLKAIPTGLKHGTITVVAEGRPFEVTTLRIDVETDGRHAEVAFTDDWKADAARRDFTFNAMSLRPDGAFFDYFDGRDDLAAGRVRFVGDAQRRVAEDYLRVLRYFRFLARFGRGEPDTEAVKACRAASDQLARLSIERVRNELFKLFAAPNPVPTLGLMRETGVLTAVLPDAGAMDVLVTLVGIDDRDPLRRLAALVPNSGETSGRALKLSKVEQARLSALAPPCTVPDPGMDHMAQRQLLYDLGAERFTDLVLLAWAGDRQVHADAWRAMLQTAQTWEKPSLPVRGSDVLALGVPPGERVGELVSAVEHWWREGNFEADREACLARLREIAAS
jgi:poly(A) polymerase